MGKHKFIANWLPVLVFSGIIVLLAMICLIVWLATHMQPDSTPPVTEPTDYIADTGQSTTPPEEVTVPSDSQSMTPQKDRLSCDKIAIFSGKFAEDGSDKPVENVATLLVTNRTDQFLDMATIQYEIDGKQANFIVSGLPAGESCWVMEYTAMTITAESSLKYIGCSPAFRDGAVKSAKEVTISADGNILSATNNTDAVLKDVFVYYKSLKDDGNYLGGITYMVKFGDIEPGQTVEKLGGHYTDGSSVIVRVGWQ